MTDSGEPDNRRHHWVPVSYLRPWCDARGHVNVARLVNGRVANRFKKRPEELFKKQGYNNLEKPEPGVPHNLLEEHLFAKASEASFVRIMRSTFEAGKMPTSAEALFLADYCCELFIRNPKYELLMSERIVKEAPEDSPFLGDTCKATRIAMSVIALRSQVFYEKIMFLTAPQGHCFPTSDTPSWQWFITPKFTSNQWDMEEPTWCGNFGPQVWVKHETFLNFDELYAAHPKGASVLLCALNPRHLLIAFPRNGIRKIDPVVEHLNVDWGTYVQMTDRLLIGAGNFQIIPHGFELC